VNPVRQGDQLEPAWRSIHARVEALVRLPHRKSPPVTMLRENAMLRVHHQADKNESESDRLKQGHLADTVRIAGVKAVTVSSLMEALDPRRTAARPIRRRCVVVVGTSQVARTLAAFDA
jgi:hypothetical protein